MSSYSSGYVCFANLLWALYNVPIVLDDDAKLSSLEDGEYTTMIFSDIRTGGILFLHKIYLLVGSKFS